MEIKVIKTQQDYLEALREIKRLMLLNPDTDSAEAEILDLLATLVQDYESKTFVETLPDPIDAILFRMEQQKLKASDLVPYIGSKSKVSEILARKRPLSLNMIKSLHDGLGIPAKVLLNQSRLVSSNEIDYDKFPIEEMKKRGYISSEDEHINSELNAFFAFTKGMQGSFALSRTFYIRSHRPINQNSLFVWMTQVLNRVKVINCKKKYNVEYLTLDFLKKVVDISDEENAIYKVIDLLKSIGIIVVIEPSMPQTYLDAAAIMLENENPIIGMTLRHDRLDNFWFSLLHELAHIKLHYGQGTTYFYDDVETVDVNDPREKEADEFALKVMIPEDKWINSPASIVPSPNAAKLLARQLSIHTAIVAGKMRYERRHYHFLNSLIGNGEVRKYFTEFKWKK